METSAQRTQLEQAWQWRYACKKFDPNRKITDSDWTLLQKSLQNAPSSYGLQPYQFVWVKTPQLRNQLREVSWNQSQVTDSSHYVVFTSKSKMEEKDIDRFVELTARTRGFPPENMKNYRDMMVNHVVKSFSPDEALSWTRRQAYIAMGFLLETAALLHIDSTPMEGIDAKAYDNLLQLTGTGYQTVAAVALGYRHEADEYQKAAKVRYSISDLVITR